MTVLRIPSRELSESVVTSLREWQADVDRHADYSLRVSEADRLYRSRSQLPPFTAVRSALAGMCPGAQRCMYCEDSAGEQVDHFRPKSLYPEAVFAWLNFLYACGGCNNPKNNEFAVLVAGRPLSVARKKGAPVAPPLIGPPALLDPRQEDLMTFLELELPESFKIHSRPGLSAEDEARAQYTIATLRLNREFLFKSRRHTYRALIALLEQFIARRDSDRRDDMARIEREIRTAPHPAVWFEMRRQHAGIEELRLLFTRVPEALTWEWLPDAA